MDPSRSMESAERSFIDGMKRRLAAGRSVNALVYVASADGRLLDDPPPQNSFWGRFMPLVCAAKYGWCRAITWLLENGADVQIGSPLRGIAPLHVAARKGPRLAAILLLDAGARVDERDRDGMTALHCAAAGWWNDRIMCKLLLSRGASLDVRNNAAKDPEAHARRLGNTATAAFLAEVRAAGGWDKYVHEPRADLLALRQQLPSLRERGRASPSTVRAHERLFLNTSLPDEVFSQILAFWRTSRDY